MSSLPLLSLITFLPLAGALGLFAFVRGDDARARRVGIVRGLTLGTTLLTLAGSLALLPGFDPAAPGFQFVENVPWIPRLGLAYHRGVDGIGLAFLVLTAFLTPLSVLAGFSVKTRVKEFMIALLVLETLMLGTFSTLDLALFYVFFEGGLIPMFLMIGIWGGEGRRAAAFKFFLYTFAGSVLMLVAIIAMVAHTGTADMTQMTGGVFAGDLALVLWLAFFASFAVKTPLWPFHTWLPYAHVEAPTAGSMILAGVLLKMGGYGFIRISLQILPSASEVFAPLVIGLSVIAIIYGSLVALAQTDLKRLVAYSSVAHMGYVTLGIFSGTAQGLEGAMMVMLSHGLVSAALFACVGVVYDRVHTREIARFGGLASRVPRYAAVFMVFTLAAVGLPGLSGFVGEFLSLQGAYLYNPLVAALASLGVILGAVYMLGLYRRMFYGPLEKKDLMTLRDLTVREGVVFGALAVPTVWMGLFPAHFLAVFAPATDRLLNVSQTLAAGSIG